LDLTGTYPVLTDADSVYAIKEYSEKMEAALEAQIKTAACKLSMQDNRMTIQGGVQKIIPFWVDPESASDFAQGGMAVQPDGSITVPAAGVYSLSASMGAAGTINGAGLKIYAKYQKTDGTIVQLGASEITMGATAWLNVQIGFARLKLPAGATVQLIGLLTGTTGTLPNSGETTYASLGWVSA